MRSNYLIVESVDVKDVRIKDYLSHNPLATFYHLPEYVQILAKESGQEFILLLCLNEKDLICGYLPLVSTKGIPFKIGEPLTAKRLSSLPRTPLCGPLYQNIEILKLLLTYAVSKINSGKDIILQIKSSERYDEISSDIQSYYWRRTFTKEIPAKNEKINYKNHQIEKEVSRIVRKADREKIEFYEAQDITDLEKWYKIYLENARFHLSPARSIDFFKNLWNEFHPIGMIRINLIVDKNKSEKKLLAGTLSFRYKNQVWGGYKGRSIKKYLNFADDLLHYYEFLQAQNNNYKFFDLGEVAEDDPGLENYKKKWGVIETRVFHNYYSQKTFKFNTELSSGKKRKLIEITWRSLPLKATSLIGKKINNLL